METKYKTFDTEIKQETSTDLRRMTFTISTGAVDRDGDIVDPKGWDLKHYLKNPTVLFAHDYSALPVAKAVSVQKNDSGLVAVAEFPPVGVYPFADTVYEMLKSGFLNATSVGFQPTECEPMKNGKGYHHKSQQLLEWSIVPVPSNPEALALRGIEGDQAKRYAKAMRHWTKDVLGDEAPKLDAEQFDNLADAIAKAMKSPEPKIEDKKTDMATLDYAAIAVEVAKILKPEEVKDISTDVLNIEQVEGEIAWDSIKFPEPTQDLQLDAEAVSNLLIEGMRETLREMASATAQAAINRMTGRLD
jgi:HK97 family phage prohead protease